MEPRSDQHDADGRRLGTEAMHRLRRRDVCAIEAGLTDAEFARVETEFGFRFADDYRAFLAAGLPVNSRPEPREPGVVYTHPKPWPDWRGGDPATLRQFMDWPIEGVLFDVEHNRFWHGDWGSMPDDRASALEAAQRMLADAPRMVPIYGHRYLPAGPGHLRSPGPFDVASRHHLLRPRPR